MDIENFLAAYLNDQGQIKNKDLEKIVTHLKVIVRNKIKNICEIGVMCGSSTAALYYFFPKSTIFALDINFQRFNIKSKRIH